MYLTHSQFNSVDVLKVKVDRFGILSTKNCSCWSGGVSVSSPNAGCLRRVHSSELITRSWNIFKLEQSGCLRGSFFSSFPICLLLGCLGVGLGDDHAVDDLELVWVLFH